MKRVVCTWGNFCREAGNRKIYCFGSGKQSVLFMMLLSEVGLLDNVVAFIDNSEELCGTCRMVEEREIPIIAPQQLINIIGEGIILITCSDICGIYEQLDTYKELENKECYSMYLMLSKTFLESTFPEAFKVTTEMIIPKKIHYCWFGGGRMSEKEQRCIESWHEKCPDYEIIEWNEDNYDFTKNAYMLEAYQEKKWGFVSDYARLDIIYEHGGIYLDTDVELFRNLDELLYNYAFVGFDVLLMVNTGIGFGAIKGNPLIKEMRDYYQTIHFIDDSGKIDMTSCLVHQAAILKEHGLKLNGEFQQLGEMTVYPLSSINGREPYSALNHKNQKYFLLHYGEGSWVTKRLKDARMKKKECLSALFTEDADKLEGQWVWR